MILFVTRKDDAHADLVALRLDERRHPFFRLNTEAIDEYDIELDANSARLMHRRSGRSCSSADVTSVYLRRRSLPDFPISEKHRRFVEMEWKSFLRNLWTYLSQAFWVNPPALMESASDKLAQLALARSIGFTVPDTLATNSRNAVARFLAKCSGQGAIYKPFNSGEINSETGGSIYTSVMTQSEVEAASDDEFSVCPGLYQPRLAKDFELRITVVGSRCFAAKIDSQSSPLTSLDWRRYDEGIAPHYPHELGPDTSQRCINLIRELGLKFGAIDMVVNSDGEYFLEVNPNGQWAWIEYMLGTPISGALADLLIERNAPSSP